MPGSALRLPGPLPGRRLSEVLRERGIGPGEFLASLDLRRRPELRRAAPAETSRPGRTPGARYIAVCKETFARVQSDDPGLAANVVIHEMLHALGLGEAPSRRRPDERGDHPAGRKALRLLMRD